MSARGPARYRVTCEVIVEVERPDDLPVQAQQDLLRRDIPINPLWDGIDNVDEAALQSLIRPESLVDKLAGVAFVEGTWHVEPIEPPPLWS